MARPMRISNANPKIGFVERRIVVAAVPDNYVSLFFRFFENRGVIRTCVDDHAIGNMRLVFFTFLNRALVPNKVLEGLETLYGLPCQVPVWHWMTNGDCLQAEVTQYIGDTSRNLALAAAGSDRRNRDNRLARGQHGPFDVKQIERNAFRGDLFAALIDVIHADVRVGKDHFVNVILIENLFEVFLWHDRNALWIQRASQFDRITAILDMWNLGSRKRNDFDALLVAIEAVEQVKVPAGRTHNDDPFPDFFAHNVFPIDFV